MKEERKWKQIREKFTGCWSVGPKTPFSWKVESIDAKAQKKE